MKKEAGERLEPFKVTVRDSDECPSVCLLFIITRLHDSSSPQATVVGFLEVDHLYPGAGASDVESLYSRSE